MNTRSLPLLLSVSIAAMVLAGCAAAPMRAALPAGAGKQVLRAKNAEGPLTFADAAKKANDIILTSPAWKNARLVSIEGHGFDQKGNLVPLLGSYWVFKFWANAVDEEGKPAQAVTRADVILHVEGHHELEDGGEVKERQLERVLDPSKLPAPTQVVPYAITLGLKVNPAGPQFNYYDVTYNAFYANPSMAQTDVADVTSYYRNETFDGLHIPCRPELINPAPVPAPAPAPATKRMTPQELAAETAERQHTMRR